MAFRFPLASVLGFRESVERREELALEKVHLEIATVQRAAEQLTEEIANAHRAAENALQEALPASHLHTMLNEANAAREKKKALLESLQTLEQRRDHQAKVYQTAHRARRMLSDMADRQKDAWEQDMARSQQKFLDDIFGSRGQRG